MNIEMSIGLNQIELNNIIDCVEGYLTYVDNCSETKRDLLKKLIEIQGVFLNNEC